jgi:rhamnose transport system ATP-binding protein
MNGEETTTPAVSLDLAPDAVAPVLVVEGATKFFGPVKALIDGSITLYPGEAHALLGENGAGKSTLVKILAGVHSADGGRIILEDAPVRFASPIHAREAGISVIYQEPTLFPDLSVAENIFMGRHPLRSGKRIDHTEMLSRSREVFERLGVQLSPSRVARGLSVADQQIVEIAKAISFNAKIIIMDEPTAALSEVEVRRLFDVVVTLRKAGTAIMFISHRLEEVFAMCQRVTIMRDGAFVKTATIDELTIDEVIYSMVGRDIVSLYGEHARAPGLNVLEVEHLTREGVFTDVTFNVRAGEVVGLAGLVGAGRTEVARGIFGIDRVDAGSVRIMGHPLKAGSPLAAMRAGIGFVPEDRRQQGLVMEMAIDRNASLASIRDLSRFGLIRKSAERKLASEWAARLQLKFGRFSNPVKTLSGGNQQKVVLAKWLSRHPRLLIIDEPTRGIDIGTKAEVHRLLGELVEQGIAILMISSEMSEVLGVADRILVLHEGRIAGEFGRDEADEASIMRAAAGQAKAEAS